MRIRLEVRRAYYDVDASRQQMEVARAAIAQAQESLRINQDRYDGGLTTITDLLGAEEAARRSSDRLLGSCLSLPYQLREPGVGQRDSESSISGGDAMTRTHSILSGLLPVAVILAGGLGGCSSERPPKPAVPEIVRNVSVLVVQRADVPDLLEAVGTVRAAQTSQLASQMVGQYRGDPRA